MSDTANKASNQTKEQYAPKSLTDTNHLAYATASAVTESLGDLKTEGIFSTRTKLKEKTQRHFIEN